VAFSSSRLMAHAKPTSSTFVLFIYPSLVSFSFTLAEYAAAG
jgi:hypothetical protein